MTAKGRQPMISAMIDTRAIREHRRNRLASLLQQQGINEVSRKTGVSVAYLYQMSTAKGSQARPVSDAKALDLERALGLPRGWFDSMYPVRTDEDGDQDGDVTIDVADIELSAGAGAAAPEFAETHYRHTYRAAWLRSEGVKDTSTLRRCRVRGSSMERTLYNGDMVLIDTARTRLVDDAVFALVLADQLLVKRLRRRPDGGIIVVSDNPEYDPVEIELRDIEQVRIIGRVIEKSGKGGL